MNETNDLGSVIDKIVDNITAHTELIGRIIGILEGLTGRVAALEERQPKSPAESAETKQELEAVRASIRSLATDFQRAKDVLDVDEIEKRLAAEGIAPPEDAR